MKRQIDIIVPVYNGLEDLKLCVESVKTHTDLSSHRLILVDDKSPDPEILPYLKSIATESIHVIESAVNEGFSASVNKGMEYSTRDVILLNSDTIVTKGWVDKMIRCAYSKKEIATVTPMSNAATLCSVPEFLQDNPIPEGYTIDEMAQLVEDCSLRRYPRISVAVGFCMYIKREVIDQMGGFDAKAFGKGYGEENDYCYRAEIRGYTHNMCDDTFIYHKGTASFDSEEKKRLIEEHEKILRQRYDEYVDRNEEYCAENPNRDLQENIKLYLKLDPRKSGTLYLTEGPASFEMTPEDKVFVVRRLEDRIRVIAKYKGRQTEFCFWAPKTGIYMDRECKEEEEILLDLMKAFNLTAAPQRGFREFAGATLKNILNANLEERIVDTRRILSAYLRTEGLYLSTNDPVEGIYAIEIKELKEKYKRLSHEDDINRQELYNIYNSKRYQLACFLEELIRPFRYDR